jgi:TRAP-type uncharacterized transport system substrate-binding protein
MESMKTWAVLFLLALSGLFIAYQFVEPAPPKSIAIATGPENGAYYNFAQQYRRILARDGITLTVLPTKGSVENLQMLESGAASLALIQGGTAAARDKENLQSLGGLFLEPIWLFSRRGESFSSLSDLKGRRVAVGAPGSGTRLLVVQLLAASRVTERDASFFAEGTQETARRLVKGEIDAAFFVASSQAPLIQEMLRNKAVQLSGFPRSQAYSRIFPFLIRVTLHEGILDLGENIPARALTLLATVASLASRKELNSNLVPALLEAVKKVHGAGGLLEERGQFPSADIVDIPMDEDSRRYLKEGPTFLYRILPYRAAVFFDRTKILLLPFIALLYPLFQVGPPLYRWRIRSRIFRWYAILRETDGMIQKRSFPQGAEKQLERLRELEKSVAAVSVPLVYMGDLYNLRLHIRFMTNKLEDFLREHGEASTKI